jgi:hypothetical protein
MAVEVCEVVNPIGPANAIVAEASRANVSEVSAADMTQAGPADVAQGRCANVTAAKMHAAEMTAATEVATATTTVAAAAAACKGVSREAQRANCDARQEHPCCLGHHDLSPDIGPRVCTRRLFT